MKKQRMFKCNQCGVEFDEELFDISCGTEIVICCPMGCIIGSVYIPNISDVKEIK